MSERMKGFTCCGDCINYNYKKHKCNLGASIETDARNPFYDDCPIPDIPSDKKIRDKAIEEALEKSAKAICVGCAYLNGHECTYKGANCGVSKPMLETVVKALKQMKEAGE